MGYYNPIYIYGVDRFLVDAKAAGVDGLIVVDLPPEEDDELCLPALKAGLNFIRLATPTTDDKRLPAVLANTSGFVYYVSITGITGAAAPTPARSARRSRASSATPNCRSRRLRRPHRRSRPAPLPKTPMASWSARRWSMGCAAASMQKRKSRPAPSRRWPIWWRRWRKGVGAAKRRRISHNWNPDRVTAFLPGIVRRLYIVAIESRLYRSAMNWISNVVRPKIRSILRRETPENLWIKCPDSGQLVFYKDVEANQFVIPGSNYHMRMAARG
jgi:hypothetical protein